MQAASRMSWQKGLLGGTNIVTLDGCSGRARDSANNTSQNSRRSGSVDLPSGTVGGVSIRPSRTGWGSSPAPGSITSTSNAP